jgi:hypothetical protein
VLIIFIIGYYKNNQHNSVFLYTKITLLLLKVKFNRLASRVFFYFYILKAQLNN